MKLITIIIIILIIIGIIIGVIYFLIPKDKCIEVNCNDNNPCTIDLCNSKTGDCVNNPKQCTANKGCNAKTGDCETQVNILDEIEKAILDKLTVSIVSSPLNQTENITESNLSNSSL